MLRIPAIIAAGGTPMIAGVSLTTIFVWPLFILIVGCAVAVQYHKWRAKK